MPMLPAAGPGLPAIEITLRRSARARRFSLRVSRLDGRVTLSVPLRAREAEAQFEIPAAALARIARFNVTGRPGAGTVCAVKAAIWLAL